MGGEKPPAKTGDLRDLLEQLELRLVDPLKRRITWEGKKVDTLLKGLGVVLRRDLESAKEEVLEAVHRVETSVDLLAQEVARHGSQSSEEPGRDAG